MPGSRTRRGTRTVCEWIICIVMPEREIMAHVWRNNLWMLGIGTGTMLAAVLAGLYVARQIARPLEQLVREAHVIGQFDVQARPPVSSRVQEVTDLGVALEEMKTGLRSFQKYVPVDLVRALIQTRQEARLGGQAATLSIFFCDIAGFTTIAEAMKPGDLVEQLSEFLGVMSAEIIATGGTVDKYIGDAIMAFWGAPQPNAHHALAACTAALQCRTVLNAVRRQWQAAGKPLFEMRIGLNTGEVVVGNIGSETRMNFTAVGDAVNLASRLEDLNRHYGTDIIISESTFEAAQGGIVARPLDWVAVKGKTKVVLIYELLGLQGKVDPSDVEAVRISHKALGSYRKRDWDLTIKLCNEVLRLRPGDSPSQRLVELCRTYQASPPGDDWDGVNRLTRK